VTRPARVFLLSPAHCGGERARILLSERAAFPLAVRLRSPQGAALGEVFAFMSGLYFRGKLAYARRFAQAPGPPDAPSGVMVITAHAGLCPPETVVTVASLQRAARVEISADNPRYARPLRASARALARGLAGDSEVVLLGSVATGKYLDALLEVFGDRLRFPAAFVGRGDMSRGGLLLRCAAEGTELEYVPVAGAARHGPRPPRLDPGSRPRPVDVRAPALVTPASPTG
jgi:hypothetical protein